MCWWRMDFPLCRRLTRNCETIYALDQGPLLMLAIQGDVNNIDSNRARRMFSTN